MSKSVSRLNWLLREYRDPVALAQAISNDYLVATEGERAEIAMALIWQIAATSCAQKMRGGA